MNKNNKLSPRETNNIIRKTNVYYSISLQLKIILFKEKYPKLSFCDLKKLIDRCSNDNNCIYYKHKLTNSIYTWNYINKKWI